MLLLQLGAAATKCAKETSSPYAASMAPTL